jgi:GT2 family glycosyltransferase/glycosyltransferase involved in cell wall biosynthesis
MIRLVPGTEERERFTRQLPDPLPTVEILVPVHNEWHVLRPCLESLDAFTDYPGASITVLDDGSDRHTQRRIEQFVSAENSLPSRVLRNEKALGFVQNSNLGMRQTTADMVVLLNSDTIVTPGWLHRMVDAALSEPRIASVMPMSNQASFHSVDVPMGWNIFQYGAALARSMRRTCFDTVTSGGFCLLLKRKALEDVGLFDEAFGMGYGEESDWCMRAAKKGWRVVASEDVFVYHRGKVTFKDFKDETFREGNYQLFMSRWGESYRRAIAKYKKADPLSGVRSAFVRMDSSAPPPILSALYDRVRMGGSFYAMNEASRYVRDQGGVARVPTLIRERGLLRPPESQHPLPRGFQSRGRPRVTYVLEKFSISGGVLSVVQLVNRLTMLGWDAKIATHHDHDQRHLSDYMLYHTPYVFSSAETMIRNFPETDLVVATLWSTAEKVHRIVNETRTLAVPWYFVQDDETGFFAKWDAEGRRAVMRSYELIPDRIVKTDWLAETLAERGHTTRKVPLGMDLDLFYVEDPGRPRPLRVLGMARPRTPRRGFDALIETMRRIKSERPEVEVCLYGCANLDEYDLDFEHTDLGLVPHARLRRVYNDAQVLLDTSSFQGFGRMGLEAMACGCATVLTRFGGVVEYARHEENSLMVDPSDRDETVGAVLRLLDDDALRARLVQGGYRAASRFSCDEEARHTSLLFAESLGIECDAETGAVGFGARVGIGGLSRDGVADDANLYA